MPKTDVERVRDKLDKGKHVNYEDIFGAVAEYDNQSFKYSARAAVSLMEEFQHAVKRGLITGEDAVLANKIGEGLFAYQVNGYQTSGDKDLVKLANSIERLDGDKVDARLPGFGLNIRTTQAFRMLELAVTVPGGRGVRAYDELYRKVQSDYSDKTDEARADIFNKALVKLDETDWNAAKSLDSAVASIARANAPKPSTVERFSDQANLRLNQLSKVTSNTRDSASGLLYQVGWSTGEFQQSWAAGYKKSFDANKGAHNDFAAGKMPTHAFNNPKNLNQTVYLYAQGGKEFVGIVDKSTNTREAIEIPDVKYGAVLAQFHQYGRLVDNKYERATSLPADIKADMVSKFEVLKAGLAQELGDDAVKNLAFNKGQKLEGFANALGLDGEFLVNNTNSPPPEQDPVPENTPAPLPEEVVQVSTKDNSGIPLPTAEGVQVVAQHYADTIYNGYISSAPKIGFKDFINASLENGPALAPLLKNGLFKDYIHPEHINNEATYKAEAIVSLVQQAGDPDKTPSVRQEAVDKIRFIAAQDGIEISEGSQKFLAGIEKANGELGKNSPKDFVKVDLETPSVKDFLQKLKGESGKMPENAPAGWAKIGVNTLGDALTKWKDAPTGRERSMLEGVVFAASSDEYLSPEERGSLTENIRQYYNARIIANGTGDVKNSENLAKFIGLDADYQGIAMEKNDLVKIADRASDQIAYSGASLSDSSKSILAKDFQGIVAKDILNGVEGEITDHQAKLVANYYGAAEGSTRFEYIKKIVNDGSGKDLAGGIKFGDSQEEVTGKMNAHIALSGTMDMNTEELLGAFGMEKYIIPDQKAGVKIINALDREARDGMLTDDEVASVFDKYAKGGEIVQSNGEKEDKPESTAVPRSNDQSSVEDKENDQEEVLSGVEQAKLDALVASVIDGKAGNDYLLAEEGVDIKEGQYVRSDVSWDVASDYVRLKSDGITPEEKQEVLGRLASAVVDKDVSDKSRTVPLDEVKDIRYALQQGTIDASKAVAANSVQNGEPEAQGPGKV